MGKKILTLNIGASAIALAEYETGGRQARLVNYGTAALAAPLDSGNAETILVPAIMEVVRATGIRPGKVAISVSGQMVFPRFAAIPLAGNADRFEQYVRNEIEQNIPFPIDEMVCDRQILGDTETGDKSVMIIAAKIDQIEAITDAVQSAGFAPEIVGVAPLAVTNVLKANTAGDDSCQVVLDIGAKTTSLVIVEGEKIYNRSIPVAGNTITKEIAQALGITQDEAEQIKRENAYVSMGGVTEDEDETLDRISKVCRAVLTRLHAEITRSINFYRSQQGGSAPVKLYLTGGTSLLPQLAEFFQDSLQIEVDYLNPFERVGVGGRVDTATLESDSAVLSATAGLALQAAGAAELNINLMPPAILAAKAEVARIPFVAIGAIGFVVAAALWLVAAMKETDAVVDQVDPVTAQAAEAQNTKQAVETALAAYEETATNACNLARQLKRRDQVLSHIQLVRDVLDERMWISSWDEKVEVTEVEEKSASNSPSASRRPPKKTTVQQRTVTVTIRCWDDDMDAVREAEAARRGVKEVRKAPLLGIVTDRLKATGKCEVSEEQKSPSYGPKDCLKECTVKFTIKETENK